MKTYPRYFVGRLWSERDAYLRFDSQHRCVWVRNDGKESPQPEGPDWDADNPCDTWNEVTPEMARTRLLPETRPLRWVENCKPDKPGIWAQLNERGIPIALMVHHGDVCAAWWEPATRCYLGPIPEILPPKKKVVERLWLERLSSSTQDGAVKTVFAEHWLSDDAKADPSWIRTDCTREVER